MRSLRILAIVLVPLAAAPARASEEAEDWKLIGNALALVQQIVQLAAHSPDPAAAQKGVDKMLSGESPEANRLASGLINEILLDVPPEHRGTFVAIGRDLLVLARRQQAQDLSRDDALRARRELHAMGLRYWDAQQLAEAVKRGDRIAVELFFAARGLPEVATGVPPTGLPQAR